MEFSGKRHKKKELKEKKYKEYHQKRSKRRRKKFSSSSSDSSSDSDSSSLSSDEERCRQKRLKVKKKPFLKEKKRKKMKNSTENLGTDKVMSNIAIDTIHSDNEVGPTVEEARKCMAPMTKAEWEKQQSVTRRVYDPETGRKRPIKGDGEILEEIVSKERHREINKAATRQDGEYFKKKLGLL